MQTAVFCSHSGMFCVPPYTTAVFVCAAVPQLPAQATAAPEPTAAAPELSAAPTIVAAAPTVAGPAPDKTGVPTAAPAVASAAPAEGTGASSMSGGLLAALAVVAVGLAGAFVYFRRRR